MRFVFRRKGTIKIADMQILSHFYLKNNVSFKNLYVLSKYVYIHSIYTVYVCFVQKMADYHMGIIWILYGYPMVEDATEKVKCTRE